MMQSFKHEKVWDLITRLWHWVLVLALSLTFVLGKNMSFENISWHFYIGYFILGLVVIRLIRGFIGPSEILFKALLSTPKQLFLYASTITSRKPSGTRGHNPLGSLSVLAMLALILAQAVSGLFIESDDFFEYGPLAGLVSETVVNKMTWWHHTFANVLFVIVAAHIAAILFYLIWKRENLIKPMINGMKLVKNKKHNNEQKL